MRFSVHGVRSEKLRFVAILLSIYILCALLTAPSAVSSASNREELADINGHWAEAVIRKWVSQGLAKGYGDGRFGPNDSITRAEFVTLLNRIFGYQQKSDKSFPDVRSAAWYAPEIAKAHKAGIISGDNMGNMNPEAVISRQEATVILTRAFSLTGDYIDAALKYVDVNQIAEWALGSVGTMTRMGYVTGRPGNLFAPKANLSRAEAVKMIDNVMGELINAAGTYTRIVPGNMVISSPGVTLKDTYIAGDLYLTEGIGSEPIQLIGIEIKGRTIVADGVDTKYLLSGTNTTQENAQGQPTPTPTGKPGSIQPSGVSGSTTPTTTPGSSTPSTPGSETQPTTAPTPTPTQNPTTTPTPTPTSTVTLTPTGTVTPSPTGTATPTPTQGPTPTQTSVTYYVDYESGDDNNDGLSPDTAWKHAPIDVNAEGKSRAVVLFPGDTILFRSDVVYRGKMLARSEQGRRTLGMGAEGNPITLKGDGWGEGKAIIDGSVPITGWERCRSSSECGGNENWENIWVATVPPEWRTGTNRAITLNTYQGEKMMSVAQYPDQPNIFYFDDTDYFAVSDNYTESWLEDDALGGIDLNGSFLALWGGNNSVLIRTPTSIDPLTNRVTYEAITNPYGRYSILNSIDTKVLNRPGEFYYDESNGKLYIWPFDDADPTKGEITISVQSNGIEFWSGNDYVAVEGFIVQKYIGRGITWSQSPVANGCIIRNNVIRYCRNVDTTNSIHVGAMMNALVEGNEVYRNAGPLRGIACLGGSGHIVRNNTVRESGRTGIYFTSVSNGMILNNTVIDNTGKHSNGISVYGNSSDVLVAGNQVYNSNIAYTMEQSKDIYLFNNIFIGSHGNTGISVWSGMNGMHLYHNLIGGWYLGSASNNVNTANNIIIGTGTSPETENMDLFLKAKPATDMTTLFYRSPVVSSLLADVNKYDSVVNISTVYLVDEGYENIIAPGYYLRYDQSTVHQITSVSREIYKGNWRVKIELSTPIVAVKNDAYVEVWKSNDDFTIDYHLFDGSITVDKGMDLSGVIPFEKFPLYDFSKDFDGSPRVGKWILDHTNILVISIFLRRF